MDIRLVVLAVLFLAVSGRPHGSWCPMSRYVTVSTTDLKILKVLQSELEKNPSNGTMKCYKKMRKPSVFKLKPSDQLTLTLERVSMAVDVLLNLSDSEPVLQSLMIFLKLRDDLMICRESPEYSEPASRRMKSWLHRLRRFKQEASPKCVQDAVLLSLIRLRVEDVSCFARRHVSVHT